MDTYRKFTEEAQNRFVCALGGQRQLNKQTTIKRCRFALALVQKRHYRNAGNSTWRRYCILLAMSLQASDLPHLANIVRPSKPNAICHTVHAQQPVFDICGCIPKTVVDNDPVRHNLLTDIGLHIVRHCKGRSMSRAWISECLRLYNLVIPSCYLSLEELKELDAIQWLGMYEKNYINRPTGVIRQLCPEVFRRHIRLLTLLCATPQMQKPQPIYEMMDADTTETYEERVATLFCRVCGNATELQKRKQTQDENAARSLEPSDIRTLLESASTSLQKFVIVLFLTTGLRIGGLARLSFPTDHKHPICTVKRAWQTPTTLTTIEKGGKTRKINMNTTCRLLLARWCSEERPRSEVPYVFVVGRDVLYNAEVVANRVIRPAVVHTWRVAKLTTPPCTSVFRHTVIQMLFMNGMNFEAIAKWIGHRHAATTAGVYCRLKHEDVDALVQSVPLLPSGQRPAYEDGRLALWRDVARYVRKPYRFDPEEYEKLETNPVPQVGLSISEIEALRRLLQKKEANEDV